MKKLYFTVLSFFASLTLVNSQVLLQQSNHAPVSGDMYQVIQIDSTGINPGASGSSAVWTFTTPNTRTLAVTNNYTTVASVASGSLYPSATVVETNNNTKNFYSSSSSVFNFWGGNFTALTQSVDYYFSTPAIYMVYPMAYGTSTSSPAFSGSLKSGANNGTISNGNSNIAADGMGTLNLPGRSFPNALRVKTYTYFDYSIPAFFATGNIEQFTWDYYTQLANYPSTKLFPLFRIITSTITVSTPTNVVQTSTIVLLNKDYQYVGINENSSEVSELNLFPNPATNNFSLVFVNENAQQVTVEISNALGQLVRKENLENTKGLVNQSVNIEGIEAGVYFVKVNVGAKSSVKKLTIQ
ncbi:MAG: T9SS type A sorting domain-containing protein [Bacteroidia bacterium]|nr:T9SS type A sorting domain-containing protein [Bacteroidia bacterium]